MLEKNIDVFSFCGNLQEEVHRYAISYHKKLRDVQTQQSELTEIKGIGKTKAKNIFLHFKSIDKIKKASAKEIAEVKGITPELAESVAEYFKKKED